MRPAKGTGRLLFLAVAACLLPLTGCMTAMTVDEEIRRTRSRADDAAERQNYAAAAGLYLHAAEMVPRSAEADRRDVLVLYDDAIRASEAAGDASLRARTAFDFALFYEETFGTDVAMIELWRDARNFAAASCRFEEASRASQRTIRHAEDLYGPEELDIWLGRWNEEIWLASLQDNEFKFEALSDVEQLGRDMVSQSTDPAAELYKEYLEAFYYHTLITEMDLSIASAIVPALSERLKGARSFQSELERIVARKWPGASPADRAKVLFDSYKWLALFAHRQGDEQMLDTYIQKAAALRDLRITREAPFLFPALAYQKDAVIDGIGARALLSFTVDERGRVTSPVHLDEFNGNDSARASWMAAIERMRFLPRFDGEAFEGRSYYDVTIEGPGTQTCIVDRRIWRGKVVSSIRWLKFIEETPSTP
ncbi:MAG: hypothetical protein V2I43_27760 [Parvularcula sp.]|nr:hypothetical protein [Parvularcula sp.]